MATRLFKSTLVWMATSLAAGAGLAAPLSDGLDAPRAFYAFHGYVIFNSGHRIWRTNGTPSGTAPIGEGDVEQYMPSSARLIFIQHGGPLVAADSALNSLSALTPEDVRIETGFSGYRTSAWDPAHRVLYFIAYDPDNGLQPWRSDGTRAGTRRILTIESGHNSYPSQLVVFSGKLYFSADDSVHGVSLWQSDGTATGTSILVPGVVASWLQTIQDRLVFIGARGLDGIQLWSSDGTAGGTGPTSTLPPLKSVSAIKSARVVAGRALYVLTDGVAGEELWSTDGSRNGTRQLTQFAANEPFWRYFSFLPIVSIGQRAVFPVERSGHGSEVWLSDGTLLGTSSLVRACPGTCSGMTSSGAAHGKLFLTVRDEHGWEPWISDGTSGGTRRLKDICSGACGSGAFAFTSSGQLMFFPAHDSRGKWQLWRSDGTADGTVPLTEFPGPDVFHGYFQAVAVGKKLVFAADDGVHGVEPWVTDGTAAGTHLLFDTNP